MYYTTRNNRGQQVIQRRDMPSTSHNIVRNILNKIINQDNIITVTGLFLVAWIVTA